MNKDKEEWIGASDADEAVKDDKVRCTGCSEYMVAVGL